MASVVFEKQLANIKKGLELLHEMTQSMQELTDLSNENFMQKNIAQIQKANNELGNTAKKMQGITQQSKKSFNFKPGIKSINALKLGLTAVGKLLDGIYEKTKMIVFAGVAAIAGMGFMASNQNKKNQRAKDVGLSGSHLWGLQQAGKTYAGDEERYVNAYSSIKSQAMDTAGSAATFAKLGLKSTDFKDMSDPNQMFKVFNEIAQNLLADKNNEVGWQAFQELTNYTPQEFYREGAHSYYIQQQKQAQNSGLDALGGAGKSFDRALAQLQMTLMTIVSKLSPFIIQISDAFDEGLRNLLSNPEFNKMLKNFGEAMTKFGKNLSTHIINFFKNLPGYIKTTKEIFDTIIDAIMFAGKVFGNKYAKEYYAKKEEKEKLEEKEKILAGAKQIANLNKKELENFSKTEQGKELIRLITKSKGGDLVGKLDLDETRYNTDTEYKSYVNKMSNQGGYVTLDMLHNLLNNTNININMSDTNGAQVRQQIKIGTTSSAIF